MYINLKKIRTEKGCTQKELASHLGIDVPFYSRKENGKKSMKLEEAISIAKFLGVSLDELFMY